MINSSEISLNNAQFDLNQSNSTTGSVLNSSSDSSIFSIRRNLEDIEDGKYNLNSKYLNKDLSEYDEKEFDLDTGYFYNKNTNKVTDKKGVEINGEEAESVRKRMLYTKSIALQDKQFGTIYGQSPTEKSYTAKDNNIKVFYSDTPTGKYTTTDTTDFVTDNDTEGFFKNKDNIIQNVTNIQKNLNINSINSSVVFRFEIDNNYKDNLFLNNVKAKLENTLESISNVTSGSIKQSSTPTTNENVVTLSIDGTSANNVALVVNSSNGTSVKYSKDDIKNFETFFQGADSIVVSKLLNIIGIYPQDKDATSDPKLDANSGNYYKIERKKLKTDYLFNTISSSEGYKNKNILNLSHYKHIVGNKSIADKLPSNALTALNAMIGQYGQFLELGFTPFDIITIQKLFSTEPNNSTNLINIFSGVESKYYTFTDVGNGQVKYLGTDDIIKNSDLSNYCKSSSGDFKNPCEIIKNDILTNNSATNGTDTPSNSNNSTTNSNNSTTNSNNSTTSSNNSTTNGKNSTTDATNTNIDNENSGFSKDQIIASLIGAPIACIIAVTALISAIHSCKVKKKCCFKPKKNRILPQLPLTDASNIEDNIHESESSNQNSGEIEESKEESKNDSIVSDTVNEYSRNSKSKPVQIFNQQDVNISEAHDDADEKSSTYRSQRSIEEPSFRVRRKQPSQKSYYSYDPPLHVDEEGMKKNNQNSEVKLDFNLTIRSNTTLVKNTNKKDILPKINNYLDAGK